MASEDGFRFALGERVLYMYGDAVFEVRVLGRQKLDGLDGLVDYYRVEMPDGSTQSVDDAQLYPL